MKLKMKEISGKYCNSSLSIYYKNIQQSTALLGCFLRKLIPYQRLY